MNSILWVGIIIYFGYVLVTNDGRDPGIQRLQGAYFAEGFSVAAWFLTFRLSLWSYRMARRPTVEEDIELQEL